MAWRGCGSVVSLLISVAVSAGVQVSSHSLKTCRSVEQEPLNCTNVCFSVMIHPTNSAPDPEEVYAGREKRWTHVSALKKEEESDHEW